MTTSLVLILVLLFIACVFLANKSDRYLDLENRITELERVTKKIIVSRLEFIQLKSVNAALDTINNCFYDIDDKGNYIVDSEYRLSDVTDEWWKQLSEQDLDIVNKMAHKL